jgi:hypothetical protein
VEIKPLAQLLEDMLYEASDEGLEVCLAEAVLDERTDENAVRGEYLQRYSRALLAITEHRGPPWFSGKRGEPGHPEWLQLDTASCWSDAAGVIYIGLATTRGHMRLLGGGRPHPVRREAITLLPSAG